MKFVLTFALFLFNLSCGTSNLGQQGSVPPSHAIWQELLQKYVTATGKVSYKGFIQEKQKLQTYLNLLSNSAPDRSIWSKEEQVAYWINTYNAFTVKLIIDHYPVKSIREIKPTVNIPLVNTVWHIEFFKIGGKPASLDEIEHKILRKEFDEPRIHFAINCASFSCPILLNEAFVPEKLESQLDRASRQFINDPHRNRIAEDKAEISQIFSWFQEDFTKKGTLIDFLNHYSKVKIKPNAKISHLDYNWSLNE